VETIQAGDLENSDSHKVKLFFCQMKNGNSFNSYALNTPASPHFAAEHDGIIIDF
jgi:dethiobiotin synthetase